MKMIKITMEFTSVEQAVKWLMRDPAAERSQITHITDASVATTPAKPKAEAPKDEPAAAASSPKPDESQAAGETAEVTYDELKKSIMKLVAIDPKHMREIADSFGVKTFQGTTADVWPKAKKAVDDKIVALRG